MSKKKVLCVFDTETHKKGVQKSIKEYGNKRSFSTYINKLIQKDNE